MRIEGGWSLASMELERQGLNGSYENGSLPPQEVKELEREFALAKKWDRTRKDDDYVTERRYRRLVGRVRWWTVLNDVYLPVYPMAKQFMRQMEHVFFNGNGQFSSNGHSENGHGDISKIG